MASIKGYQMKRVATHNKGNQETLKRATIRYMEKKIGSVTETVKDKALVVRLGKAHEAGWKDAVEAFWQESQPDTELSKETYFIYKLMELTEDEHRYIRSFENGNPILAMYYDKVTEVVDGQPKTRRIGRLRIINTDVLSDIEEMESTIMKDIPFDRKLYCSMDDFILQ